VRFEGAIAMTDSVTEDGSTPRTNGETTAGRRWLPTTGLGWWSLVLTVVFFPVLGAMMFLARSFAGTVLDTWVVPVLFLVWIDTAAMLGLLAVLRGRERALLPLISTAVASAVGLFATMMVVGEALGPQPPP
jgi:hypothetical protein